MCYIAYYYDCFLLVNYHVCFFIQTMFICVKYTETIIQKTVHTFNGIKTERLLDNSLKVNAMANGNEYKVMALYTLYLSDIWIIRGFCLVYIWNIGAGVDPKSLQLFHYFG